MRTQLNFSTKPAGEKLMELAIPVCLVIACLIGLLWEHDGEMNAEKEEWDTFFRDWKIRQESNEQTLQEELKEAKEGAEMQDMNVKFLQRQQLALKQNISDLETALNQATELVEHLNEQLIARDRAYSVAERKLFKCDEAHEATMKKLDVMLSESHELHNQIDRLERKKNKLTLNLRSAGIENPWKSIEHVEIGDSSQDVSTAASKNRSGEKRRSAISSKEIEADANKIKREWEEENIAPEGGALAEKKNVVGDELAAEERV